MIDPEVVSAFRNVMDSIVVQPTGYREPYVVDAYGRLSAIMGVIYSRQPGQAKKSLQKKRLALL